MSWSFSAIGKPDAVKRAIIESSNNTLTGPSLTEWNDAKPALLALVGANVGNVVKVNATGSASMTYGQCACVIEPIYGFVE